MAAFEVGILDPEKIKGLGKRLGKALDQAEFRTVEFLKVIAGTRMTGILTSDLKRRTGNLAKSAAASVANAKPQRTPDGWSVRIGYGSGPSSAYARIQEEGGTVYPVNAKVLAIPVGEALTATGRPRYASPKEVPGGFWITARSGEPIFVVNKALGKGEHLAVLFIGASKVKITGRHAAERARVFAQEQARPIFEREVRAALG